MTDHVVTAGRSDHVRDLLSSYLNGDLEEAERRAVEGHLESCENCRADLSTLRLTVSALRQLPMAARPRDFAIAPPPVRRPRSLAWLRLTSGALAAVLAILIGARLLFQPTPPIQNSSPAAPAARPVAPFSAAAPTAAPAAPASAPMNPPAAAPAAAAPTNTPAPAAAAAPAAAPTNTPAAAAAAMPPAPNEPKAAAPGSSAGVASTSRAMAVSTTPTPAAYPQPASAPVAPQSERAYPSGPSVMSSTPQNDAYPSPATASSSTTADSGYPSPVTANGSAPTAPEATTYPPPVAAVEPLMPTASPVAGPAAAAQTPSRESTWFTPALGILGGLVLATAAVLWAIGRRSP